MHAGVTKVNMHEIAPAALQHRRKYLIFAAINDRWLAFNELEPAVPQQVGVGLGNNFNIAEWEELCVLHLLGDDKRLDAAQRL